MDKFKDDRLSEDFHLLYLNEHKRSTVVDDTDSYSLRSLFVMVCFLHMSKGNFSIKFIDLDDFISKSVLKNQYNRLQKTDRSYILNSKPYIFYHIL